MILSFLTEKGQRVTPSTLGGVSGHEKDDYFKDSKGNLYDFGPSGKGNAHPRGTEEGDVEILEISANEESIAEADVEVPPIGVTPTGVVLVEAAPAEVAPIAVTPAEVASTEVATTATSFPPVYDYNIH